MLLEQRISSTTILTVSDYSAYTSNRRPTGHLLEHAQLLVQHGASPSLIVHYLNSNGSDVTAKDAYNLRQKLSFRGQLWPIVGQK